jgi:hypothetical protein
MTAFRLIGFSGLRIERLGCTFERPIVGMAPNARVAERAAGRDKDNDCVKALAALARHFEDKWDVDVVLVLQPNEIIASGQGHDLRLCNMVAQSVGRPGRCFVASDYLSAETASSLVGRYDLFIASRFHTLVFALSQGVPALALGWSHKYDELLALFGWRDEVVGHDSIRPADLTERAERVWNERAGETIYLRKCRRFDSESRACSMGWPILFVRGSEPVLDSENPQVTNLRSDIGGPIVLPHDHCHRPLGKQIVRVEVVKEQAPIHIASEAVAPYRDAYVVPPAENKGQGSRGQGILEGAINDKIELYLAAFETVAVSVVEVAVAKAKLQLTEVRQLAHTETPSVVSALKRVGLEVEIRPLVCRQCAAANTNAAVRGDTQFVSETLAGSVAFNREPLTKAAAILPAVLDVLPTLIVKHPSRGAARDALPKQGLSFFPQPQAFPQPPHTVPEGMPPALDPNPRAPQSRNSVIWKHPHLPKKYT